MIRIFYLSRIKLLSGRTNVYNLAKTCEALNAQKDFSVGLITTNRQDDPGLFFEKMAIHHPFPVVCLGVTNTSSRYSGKRWYEFLMLVLANLRLVSFLLVNFRKFDAIYFRDESLSPTAALARVIMRKKVFFEIHSVLKSRHRQLMNRLAVWSASGVVAISSGLKRYYQKSNANILVSLCSAAEDSWFDYTKDKSAFRKELNLPESDFLIGYTGVVGLNPNNDYYELDDIIKSLVSLPSTITCVVVGELNNNAEWLRGIANSAGVADRVIFVPWQDRSEIPKYLQAFDVNLIPKRKKDLVGDSPAKMFPALAAGRPIIAGRAECIEEVLTAGADALIVEQNNPEGWRKAILQVYQDPELGERLAHQAGITKNQYTWEKRGGAIAEFIKKSL